LNFLILFPLTTLQLFRSIFFLRDHMRRGQVCVPFFFLFLKILLFCTVPDFPFKIRRFACPVRTVNSFFFRFVNPPLTDSTPFCVHLVFLCSLGYIFSTSSDPFPVFSKPYFYLPFIATPPPHHLVVPDLTGRQVCRRIHFSTT